MRKFTDKLDEMSVMYSTAKERCVKCENFTVIYRDVYKRYFLGIFFGFLYTEKKCYYCGYEKDKLERERDEKLSKILS